MYSVTAPNIPSSGLLETDASRSSAGIVPSPKNRRLPASTGNALTYIKRAGWSAWRDANLVDDVIAAVDVERLSGDQPGRVVSQEGSRGANVFDADQTARRSLCPRLVQQRIEFGDA